MATKVISRPGMVEAKAMVLGRLGAGATVLDAMREVGRTVRAYEEWRKRDSDFSEQVDMIRESLRRRKDASAKGEEAPPARPRWEGTFEEFRKEFLERETYDHHRAWICALEGRELDPGLPGELTLNDPQRFILNTPPFHSKSATITVEYSLYQICMNPDVHIIIVSKTEKQARKFLFAIKQRLTDRRWRKLQAQFAPPGGFKQTGNTWTANMIYVGAPVASEEKDPTVEAVGIGSHVQGARAGLIICDDIEDMSNANLYEQHMEWIQDVLQSRLYGGKLILVGTRAGNRDVYSALLDGDNYISGESPWSHLRQPAVLAFSDDARDWKTLWPKASSPLDPDSRTETSVDGQYPAWDGPALSKIRNSVSATKWALLYQQEEANEDSTFKREAIWGSVNRMRKPGPLTAGAPGHPRTGKEGLYTIAGMDPNYGAGMAAVVVISVDRTTQKRWLENVFVKSSPSSAWTIDTIKDVTTKYGVNEWVVEKNGFQGFLINLPEITKFLSTRGVKMSAHHTGSNKMDPDLGILSLSGLFGTLRRINDGAGRNEHNKDNLITLPDPAYSEGVKTLIEHLLLWMPGKRGKELPMDAVMALWFAEIAARRILGFGMDRQEAKSHATASKYMSRRRQRQRATQPMIYTTGGEVDG